MKQYQQMLQKIIDEGERHDDRTGIGTLRLFGHCERYDLSDHRLPILTTRKMSLHVIATELEWFMKGLTEVQWLEDRGVSVWSNKKWQDGNGGIGPIYGWQWRHFGAVYTTCHRDYEGQGYDQLGKLVDELSNNPGSRRHVVTTWDPTKLEQSGLPPCLPLFQCSVDSSGRLSMALYQRSCDAFVGCPHDVAQYSLLTMILAWLCDLKPGSLTHFIGDLHLYTNHVDAANNLLKREPFPRPTVEARPGFGLLFSQGRKGLDHFEAGMVSLKNYKAHGPIKVEVAS